jgi:hypothetical protein
VWLFERGENRPDVVEIVGVVMIPLIFAVASQFVGSIFLGRIPASLISTAVLVASTFYILFKVLKIPAPRAALYTTAVLVVNVGVVIGLPLLLRK